MHKTTDRTLEKMQEELLTVDIKGLAAMLSCGYSTARKIGGDAKARIIVGRRVLYLVSKVKIYLDSLAE